MKINARNRLAPHLISGASGLSLTRGCGYHKIFVTFSILIGYQNTLLRERSLMKKSTIKIRLMKVDDFADVVRIDEKVLNISRAEYYKLKFETNVQSPDHLPASLVAEEKDGTLVGFVIGELYIGEYGINKEKATLDTIGIDPDYQNKGIGKLLLNEFMDHLRALGVQKITTLVDENDSKLTHFFNTNQFVPSKTINLERNL